MSQQYDEQKYQNKAISRDTTAGGNIVTLANESIEVRASVLSDTSGSSAKGNILTLTNPPSSSFEKLKKELKKAEDTNDEVTRKQKKDKKKEKDKTVFVTANESSTIVKRDIHPSIMVKTRVPNAQAGRDVTVISKNKFIFESESKYSNPTSAQLANAESLKTNKTQFSNQEKKKSFTNPTLFKYGLFGLLLSILITIFYKLILFRNEKLIRDGIVNAIRKKYLSPSVANIKRLLYIRSSPVYKDFTNLRIIETKSYGYRGIGYKRSIPYNREQIGHEDLNFSFNYESSIDLNSIFRQAGHTLLEGEPGVGKTIFLKYIANQWALEGGNKNKIITSLNSFDVIIWLPLYLLHECNSDIELAAFIHKVCFSEDDKKLFSVSQVKSLILDNKHVNVLFLLDGYDEVVMLSREKTKRGNLLHYLFQQEHFILTSRPYQLTQDDFARLGNCRYLLNIGFIDQDIELYINRFFESAEALSNAEKENKAKSLILSLNSYQYIKIKAIANIPINLELICSLWDMEQNFNSFDDSINLTMTKFYYKILANLLKRFLLRLQEIGLYDARVNVRGLPDDAIYNNKECLPIIKFLNEIAWNNLKRDSQIIKSSEIKELMYIYFPDQNVSQIVENNLFTHLQLLKGIGEPKISPLDQDYMFAHSIFQSFFAALFAKEAMLSDGKEIHSQIMRYKYFPKYEIAWWFFAGFLKDRKQHLELFFNILENEPKDLGLLYHLMLLIRCMDECAFEVNNERKEILLANLNNWINFKGIKIFSYPIVRYYLLHCQSLFHQELIVNKFNEMLNSPKTIYGLLSSDLFALDIIEYAPTLMPSKILNSVINYIQNGYFNSLAAQVLAKQSHLPSEVRNTLINLSISGNKVTRQLASQALGISSSEFMFEDVKGLRFFKDFSDYHNISDIFQYICISAILLIIGINKLYLMLDKQVIIYTAMFYLYKGVIILNNYIKWLKNFEKSMFSQYGLSVDLCGPSTIKNFGINFNNSTLLRTLICKIMIFNIPLYISNKENAVIFDDNEIFFNSTQDRAEFIKSFGQEYKALDMPQDISKNLIEGFDTSYQTSGSNRNEPCLFSVLIKIPLLINYIRMILESISYPVLQRILNLEKFENVNSKNIYPKSLRSLAKSPGENNNTFEYPQELSSQDKMIYLPDLLPTSKISSIGLSQHHPVIIQENKALVLEELPNIIKGSKGSNVIIMPISFHTSKDLPFNLGRWDADYYLYPVTKEPVFIYRVFKDKFEVGAAHFYGHPLFCRSNEGGRHNVVKLTGVLSGVNSQIDSLAPTLDAVCQNLPPSFFEKTLITTKQAAAYGALRGASSVVNKMLLKSGVTAEKSFYISQATYYAGTAMLHFKNHYQQAKLENTFERVCKGMYLSSLDTGSFILLSLTVMLICHLLAIFVGKCEKQQWHTTGKLLKYSGNLMRYGIFAYCSYQNDAIQTITALTVGTITENVVGKVSEVVPGIM